MYPPPKCLKRPCQASFRGLSTGPSIAARCRLWEDCFIGPRVLGRRMIQAGCGPDESWFQAGRQGLCPTISEQPVFQTLRALNLFAAKPESLNAE